MKKYTFLVYHKQYLEFLERLNETGVLHIIEKPEGVAGNDALRDKMQMASRIKSALKKLNLIRVNNSEPIESDTNRSGLSVLEEVENAFNEKEHLQQKLIQTEKERDRMEVWGKFSHERIEALKNAGFILNFFSCPIRKFDQEWEIIYNAFEIDRVGSTIYFVTITRPEEKIEIDADLISLSQKTACELDAGIDEIRGQIEEMNAEIQRMAVRDRDILKETETQILTAAAFDKAIADTNLEAGNKVMLLEGWCPADSEEVLNLYLEKSDIYYETAEPEEGEHVPVKLKNNRFSRMFEFIGELYDLPNYFEKDLTAYFAPFYVIFFGLCLGDAGYGLILLLGGFFAIKKIKEPAMRSVMSLLTVLGAGAVIMGIISGTFFGIGLLDAKIEWLNPLKKIMLEPDKLFWNALIFGVIQIIFGMIVKFSSEISRKGFLHSLSTLGWLILIVAGGGSAVLSNFNMISPELSKYILIISCSLGGLCIFLLNNIKRNPIVNIGAGVWDTYNMATGILGDILSYIRLFALGLSGGVMGLVFNSLAVSLGGGIGIPVVSQFVALIILLFGHGINIFIATLGSLVHPMRLTFVEFYKNSGFEGGGKKYRPFAKYKEEKKII